MIDWQQIKHRAQKNEAALERALAIDPVRLEIIFRQRAAQLSARQSDLTTKVRLDSVLVFSLGAELYGIEVGAVVEVFSLVRCSGVPAAPPELLGLINRGGEILSVVDLARLLALPEQDRADGYVMVVREGDFEVGFMVDRLEKIEPIPLASLAAAPASNGTVAITTIQTKSLSENRLGERDGPHFALRTAQNGDSPWRFSDRL